MTRRRQDVQEPRFDKAELEAVAAVSGTASLVDKIFQLVVKFAQSGQLTAGRRLPSVRQLAEDCDVSRDTVARAYDKLVAHGHLESKRGSGYYLKLARKTSRAAPSPGRTAALPFAPVEWRKQLIRPLSAFSTHMGGGSMPADWMNEAELAQALRSVARSNQRHLASFDDPLGYLPLRQQLQLKLHEIGIEAEPQAIMTTVGASEALHLVIQSCLRGAREYALVEAPGPYMVQERLAASGLETALVPRGADGPDPDTLRELCVKHQPRFFFCSSVLQNPGSGYMAPHKAFQILRLAEEFDFTIVEDDTYCDLAPPNRASQMTRLATLDQLKRVIYIGSFSKTLAPGLRVGFVAASPERIQWLAMYRSANLISNSSLTERIVFKLLSEGNYRHMCEQLRSKLDERREAVIAQLSGIGVKVENAPDSGMFLWAHLGERVDAFPVASAMLEKGHLTAPGRVFSPFEQHAGCMRFNVGMTHNSPALRELAKLLRR